MIIEDRGNRPPSSSGSKPTEPKPATAPSRPPARPNRADRDDYRPPTPPRVALGPIAHPLAPTVAQPHPPSTPPAAPVTPPRPPVTHATAPRPPVAPAAAPATPPRPPGLFGAISSFVSGVQSAVHTAQNAAANTVHTVQNAAASTVHAVQNAAANTVHTVQNTAANTVHAVQNAAASTVHTVENTAANTVNQINAGVSNFAQQLPGKLDKAGKDTWAFMNKDLTSYVTVDNALKVADALNGSAPKPTLSTSQQHFVDQANKVMHAPLHELITYDNVLKAVDAVNGDAGKPQLSKPVENVVRFGVGAALSVADTAEGLASLAQLGTPLGQATHQWAKDMTAKGPEGEQNRQAFLKAVDSFLGTPPQTVLANTGNFLHQAFIQPVLDVQQSHGTAEAAGYAVAQIADVVYGAVDNLATKGAAHAGASTIDNVAEAALKNADELAPAADNVATAIAKGADNAAEEVAAAALKNADNAADEVAAAALKNADNAAENVAGAALKNADELAPAAAAVTPSPLNKLRELADSATKDAMHAWGDATAQLGLTPSLKPLPGSVVSVTFEDAAKYATEVQDLMKSTRAWSDMSLSGWKEKLYTFGGNLDRYRDRAVHLFVGEDGLRTWGPYNPELKRLEPSLNTTARELEVAREVHLHGPGVVDVGDGTQAVQTNLGFFKNMPKVDTAVTAAQDVLSPVQQTVSDYIQLGLELFDP